MHEKHRLIQVYMYVASKPILLQASFSSSEHFRAKLVLGELHQAVSFKFFKYILLANGGIPGCRSRQSLVPRNRSLKPLT